MQQQCRVIFQELLQDSQELGSNNEHMISRVAFEIELNGNRFPLDYAILKQTMGTDFESAPLEVSRPMSYRGPLDYEAWRESCEGYYRLLIGRSGVGIRIHGATNVRMRNNRIAQPAIAEFLVDGNNAGW